MKCYYDIVNDKPFVNQRFKKVSKKLYIQYFKDQYYWIYTLEKKLNNVYYLQVFSIKGVNDELSGS